MSVGGPAIPAAATGVSSDSTGKLAACGAIILIGSEHHQQCEQRQQGAYGSTA